MKHSYICTILLFILSVSAHAQNELSGKIVNKANMQSLAGASIYIEDLKLGALSDKEGNYELKKIPAGTYVVAVRSLGFETQSRTVTVKGNTVINFEVWPSSVEEQEVVVTGNAEATTIANTPQPVTEVPNSYLVQNASTNIIDAISRVPGVSGITDGQSIAKPVIRGLGYNRVVTVNDGVVQEGQQWGDEFGIEVDPFSVDRVEILKGPASLVYGSDALSGVINLLPEKTLPEGEVNGDVLFNYQTNNGLIGNMAHVAGNINGITFSGRIDNTMAHAYQNQYDGYVLNSQFSNFNADGTIGIHRKWGYSQLHYSYFDMRTGIVEGVRDSTGAQQRQTGVDSAGDPIYTTATLQELKSYTPFLINQTVKHQKAVWDNSLSLGNAGRITARFAWQQNSRQENNDPGMPNTSNIWYLLNSINYDVRYVSPDWHGFNFSAGVTGMYEDSKNKGTLLLIPEDNLFDIGGFVIANKKVGKFDFSAGVRYDNRQFTGHDDYIDSSGNELPANDPNAIHRFTAYTSNYSGVSGSIGATYQPTKNIYIKLNGARGFRAPNVAETGSNGIHDGTVVYEIGDPNLKPEQSMEVDFTPGVKTKDITAEVSVFYNNIQNFIYAKQELDSSGAIVYNSSTIGFPDAPVFRYTQGTAVLVGGEAMIDVHPTGIKWFDWYTGFSMVDARLQNVPDSVQYLPFTPPARLRSEITATFGKLGKTFHNTYFRVGAFYSFAQNNIYNASSIYMALAGPELAASMTGTPDYLLFNAGLGSDIMNRDGRKICSIYASIDNILDKPYMDYMSRFKYYPANLGGGVDRVGVYNMGRNVSVKVLIPLNFRVKKDNSEAEKGAEHAEPVND